MSLNLWALVRSRLLFTERMAKINYRHWEDGERMGRPAQLGDQRILSGIKLELRLKREKEKCSVGSWFHPDVSGNPITLNRMLSNRKLSWLFLKALHNATGFVVAGWGGHVTLYKHMRSIFGNPVILLSKCFRETRRHTRMLTELFGIEKQSCKCF